MKFYINFDFFKYHIKILFVLITKFFGAPPLNFASEVGTSPPLPRS